MTKRPVRWTQLVCSLIVGTLVVYLRQPDRFLEPQFWAEDGLVFFAGVHVHGVASFFTPYNGYYHTIPRLVSYLAYHLVPIAYQPHAYLVASLLGMWGVICLLHLPRLGLAWPLLFSLTLTAAPVLQEVYVNLTNLLWILLLGQILILASPDPVHWTGRICELLLFVLICLTGPFIVFLMPVVVLRLWRRPSLYSLLLGLGAGVTALIQLTELSTSRVPGEFSLWNSGFLRVVARPLYVILFGPQAALDVAPLVMVFALALLSVVVVGLLLFWAWRNDDWMTVAIVVSGVCIALGILASVRNNPNHVIGGAHRYFHTAPICVLWGLLSLAGYQRRYRRVLVGCWALIMSSSLLHGTDFRQAPLEQLDWGRASGCVEGGGQCVIPINPTGWFIRFEAGPPG